MRSSLTTPYLLQESKYNKKENTCTVLYSTGLADNLQFLCLQLGRARFKLLLYICHNDPKAISLIVIKINKIPGLGRIILFSVCSLHFLHFPFNIE